MKFDQFVEQFHEVAADSDYSRHKALRGRTRGDLAAAAAVLWDLGVREIDDRLVEKILLAQVGYYRDESHLASERRKEFMDLADTQGLKSGTLNQIAHEVAWNEILKLTESGHRYIEDQSGFYIFKISKEDMT
ncbi:hypothetical protein [Streptomyces sp. 5-10]|uniref:hypothetical protein n=1 Tax=Streptomyces sp. 5-10 TaxID=878925 RepID=UPI00168AD3B7|nr:hypothetical protein [Streptomyces sp. 5-10]MBD3004658.1 hypothetical protein [Streptomyces sp. 5-10]